jgi:antirestriction protein
MNFGGAHLHEHEDLEHLSRLATLLRKHGKVFGALYNHHADIEQAETAMEEDYLGGYQDLEAWADDFLHSTGAFPKGTELLERYFDFERYARDAELGGDIYTLSALDGLCHVFWNR